MATSKKKPAAKKASSKKKTTSAAASRVKLEFPLDAARAAAIRRCLAKGKLTVTVNKVDLSKGRIGDAWIYD